MTRGTPIEGARVLITGAGSGIGRLMALDAAARGAAEVLIWDLSTESGQRVADEIAATGTNARSFTVNVGNSKQVTAHRRRHRTSGRPHQLRRNRHRHEAARGR